MAEVIWQPAALEDINGIAEWIAQHSTTFAKLQVQRFFLAADALVDQPLMGHPVPELSMRTLREIHVGSYRIIHHVSEGDRIDVLAVVHMRRRLAPKILRSRIRTRR